MEFKQLSEEDRVRLKEPFFYDEIKEVVWSSDGNNCLGPDEFNFVFSRLVRNL